jgi:rhamnosyltransferase
MITPLASITIWYNPENLGENTALKNILTYSGFFRQIYIVDNSPGDNNALARQIPNSRYIPNFNNLGIARALNQGCEVAMKDGYAWVMTMDQDSSWDNKNLSIYLNETNRIYQMDSLAVSFSPDTVHQIEIHSILGSVKNKILNKNKISETIEKKDFEYVDRVICSGNIINLKIWRDVNCFNDALFINDVDYDFCYRIIQNGYKIAKLHNCQMFHVDGEPKRTFFPHAFWYHKERIYYSIRNKYFILKNYPEFAYKHRYMASIRRIILEKLFFLEFSDLRYIIRGISDGKKNKLGKYNNLS